MLTTTKPPRCRFCKQRTENIGRLLHEACIAPWLEAERARRAREKAKQAAIKIKVDRALLRQYREKNKKLSDRHREAQREFNKFCRLRDADKPCISCGAPPGAMTFHGGRDAGHYKSVGSAPQNRYDERNVNAQCVRCNQFGAGMAVQYRAGLIERIGLAEVEDLEANNASYKWTHAELIAIKEKYKKKCKELQNNACVTGNDGYN